MVRRSACTYSRLMAKTRTTINIQEVVLDEIRESGVRNVSQYFERLATEDLRRINKVEEQDKKQVVTLTEELESLEDEWKAYAKRSETVFTQ